MLCNSFKHLSWLSVAKESEPQTVHSCSFISSSKLLPSTFYGLSEGQHQGYGQEPSAERQSMSLHSWSSHSSDGRRQKQFTYIYMHICICVCTYVHVYVYMCIYPYLKTPFTCVHEIFKWAYVHTYIYIYIYIYIYTHYTHVCMIFSNGDKHTHTYMKFSNEDSYFEKNSSQNKVVREGLAQERSWMNWDLNDKEMPGDAKESVLFMLLKSCF